MKKILVGLLVLASCVFALEFRYGVGSYDTKLDIMNFMDHDTSHDTSVFVLTNPRSEIADKIFYYYDVEYHTSDTKRQITEFANPIASHQFPVFGSVNDKLNNFIDMLPVDGDYNTLGFDINFGVGYDLLKKGDSFLAIAINSGVTMPNVSGKNIKQKAEFVYDMMDKWDLDVMTYKIGPSFRGNLFVNENLSFYSSFGFGFQKAYIESGLFKSDVDSKGGYNNFDLGLKFHPSSLLNMPKNLSFTLGHTTKNWSVDSVDVNLFNFFKFDAFRPFELELKSSYTYLGVEYKF